MVSKERRTDDLSEKAKKVNRMLIDEMSHREIADALGVRRNQISNIKCRFDLPRYEDDNVNEGLNE